MRAAQNKKLTGSVEDPVSTSPIWEPSSAARLTATVPWLCVPRLLRVCPFGGSVFDCRYLMPAGLVRQSQQMFVQSISMRLTERMLPRCLLDEALPQDVGNELSAIMATQLAKNIVYVCLDRPLCHHKLGCDLAVGAALGQLNQDVELARRKAF